MTPLTRRLAYGLYIVAAIVVFGYMLFPAKPIQSYVENQVSSLTPSYRVTMESVAPRLPAGISMSKVDLYRQGAQLLAGMQITLRPRLMSLLGSNRSYDFSGQVHQGTINGEFNIQNESQGVDSSIKTEFKGIDLTTVPGMEPWRNLIVSGTIDGRVRYDLRGNQAALGAQLVLNEVTLKPDIPIEKLDHLLFTNITADLQVNGPKLEIRQSRFSGPQGEGQITGTIHLQHPLTGSTLNLTGHFKPNPGLIMQLQGTLWGDMLTARKAQAQAGYPFRIRGRAGSLQWQFR